MEYKDYLDFEVDPNPELTEPFYQYILEDKSKYAKAKDTLNPKTGKNFYDPDGDWLVGETGGFLPNINFVFKKTYRLREIASFYNKHKVYTFLHYKLPEYNRFREREEYRRAKGFTANCKLLHSDISKYNNLLRLGKDDEADKLLKPLRVSGEQYNFINYGKIIMLDEHKVTAGSLGGDKEEQTPLFIDSQYWLTKAKEFAKSNGYHMIVLKSRRKGMSYLEGIDSANETNLHKKITIIHGAFDKKYVTLGNSLSPMARNQLNHYEDTELFSRNFPGKGLLKKDINELRVGYKTASNTDAGKQSTILAISFKDNPDAAIGKDGRKIKLDEMSNFPNFEDVMDVTEPTTRTGAYLTGFIFCGGTGGSKEGSWVQFERNYEAPGMFNFMPFENIWDANARHQTVGWFIPFWFGLQGIINDKHALDVDGNSIYNAAIAISKNERKLKAEEVGGTSSPRYTKFCSQYSNRPSEAFSAAASNIFSSAVLTNHIERVKANYHNQVFKDGNIIKQGDAYKFKTLSQLKELSLKNVAYKRLIHPYIDRFPMPLDADPHGCIRMYHPPFRDKDGNIPDGIYSGGYDTVGKDLNTPEVKIFHSLNSFFIITLPNDYGVPADLIVASYAGRPMLMKDADRYAFMACKLYNAKIMVEVDRGNAVSNFKSWGGVSNLLKDPTYIIKGKVPPANVGYGINIGGTGEKAEDGLKWTNEWFYDYSSVREDGTPIYTIEKINDLPLLYETSKFTVGLNVDRLSALRAFIHHRKTISIKSQTANKEVNNDKTIANQMCLN